MAPHTNQTRERLLAAAEQIVIDKGLVGVSVRKVGELAKTNPTLVTYHFGGIGDLLEELCSRNLSAIVDGWRPLEEMGSSAPDIETLLRAWIAPLQYPGACTGQGRALMVLDEITAHDNDALQVMVVNETAGMAIRLRKLLLPLCPQLQEDELRARIRLIAAAVLGPAPRNMPVPTLASGEAMDHLDCVVRFAKAALQA